MSSQAGSLEDVEAWALHEFPTYFAEVSNTGAALFVNIEFQGQFIDGKIVLQSLVLLDALKVGSTTDSHFVYALLRSNDVELFSEQEVDSPSGKSVNILLYMKPVDDLAGVKLDPPFSYPVQTGHPAGVDRLETLIRYLYLRNGDRTAVQSKLGFFKTHFRAACRDVARGTGAVVEADEMNDDDILPDDTPPDLVADTDTAGLIDNPAAISVFNEHVHAMDESYHDFKTSMLTHLGAMQIVDRNQMLQLQAQVQDLEHRLTVSGESCVKLSQELEVEKEKAETAEREMSEWKARYDGLRGTLQGALGQQF